MTQKTPSLFGYLFTGTWLGTLALCSALTVTQPAMANPFEELPSDNRIKLLEYNGGDIYTILTRYGYQTSIEFSPKEEILTISVGDRSVWQIIPSGTRLFLRPLVDDASTNMSIITSRRSYHFDIKSVGEKIKGDVVYVAKFLYPEDMPHAAAPALPFAPMAEPVVSGQPVDFPPARPAPMIEPPPTVADAPMVSPLPPESARQYHYSFTGPDALAPAQAFDDGRSTYVRLHSTGQAAPIPFEVVYDGSERPVNYTINGDMLVIDSIVPKLALKQRAGTVYLYNDQLYPR